MGMSSGTSLSTEEQRDPGVWQTPLQSVSPYQSPAGEESMLEGRDLEGCTLMGNINIRAYIIQC